MRERATEAGEPGFETGPTPVSRREVVRTGVLRTVLATSAGLLLPSAFDLNGARTRAQTPNPAPAGVPMTFEGVIALAEARAATPYRTAPDDLPPDLAGLSYDDYQAIRFRPEARLVLGDAFSAQLFHRGFLARRRVGLFVQGATGAPRAIAYDPAMFQFGQALLGKTSSGRTFPPAIGFAGFRLHTAFDPARPAEQDEFCVFLGASYFRVRGRGQVYGLSARGIAVGTGGPGAEEFPDFTDFWIQEAGARTEITVLALLDGPSLAGAYRFAIRPGDPTTIAVTASLHPRTAIPRLGLAPLTSMFLFGQNGPGARGAAPFDDFRPQVHDSDGLAVETPGDRLWRPLANGRSTARIAAFRADPVLGFGLLQRERRWPAYLDAQARHEDRPGLWVKPEPAAAGGPSGGPGGGPAGGFGTGSVQLYEIPAREEYVDNIVAAFVPEAPVEAGRALALAYTLTTVGSEPAPVLPGDLARVVSTRVGSAERLRPTSPPAPDRRIYAIDFEGPGLPADPNTAVEVALSASAGRFLQPFTERIPETGGWRLYAEYRPPNPLPAGDVVLRARLAIAGRPVTETWDAVA